MRKIIDLLGNGLVPNDGKRLSFLCFILSVASIGLLLSDKSSQTSTSEATTKTSNQLFEVIDLGWRDVVREVKVTECGQTIFLFGLDPRASSGDEWNIRYATSDVSGYDLGMPNELLISRDRKKIYVVKVRPVIGENISLGPVYVVKIGKLDAELIKADLPQ